MFPILGAILGLIAGLLIVSASYKILKKLFENCDYNHPNTPPYYRKGYICVGSICPGRAINVCGSDKQIEKMTLFFKQGGGPLVLYFHYKDGSYEYEVFCDGFEEFEKFLERFLKKIMGHSNFEEAKDDLIKELEKFYEALQKHCDVEKKCIDGSCPNFCYYIPSSLIEYCY